MFDDLFLSLNIHHDITDPDAVTLQPEDDSVWADHQSINSHGYVKDPLVYEAGEDDPSVNRPPHDSEILPLESALQDHYQQEQAGPGVDMNDSGGMISDAEFCDEWYVLESDWDATHFDGIGDPIHEAQFWQHQQGESSCAVVAQIGVYESITGQSISEEYLCKIAEANNIYNSETGTYAQDLGKLLQLLGVPVEQTYDATLADLAHALERGDKVIVPLNANEIWTPIRDSATGLPVEQSNAGHAVWVTGIDGEPDGSVKIILNDGGTPDGQMKAVDAEDFLNAWSNYGNEMVVAQVPAA